VTDPRPYAALLAKGEDRRQRILTVAQRLLTRNGWRRTTLAQIAEEAGLTSAGLLHHFESKDILLQAVIDARDFDDAVNTDPAGDLVEQIAGVSERFRRTPEVVGMFAVLLIENLDPHTPMHERLLSRYQDTTGFIADAIRQGQRTGRFRADLNPAVKAVEIVAFFNGMETSWLLDPSIPLSEVFQEYAQSVMQRLTV
jgi:AcrR family transcriptional regulator